MRVLAESLGVDSFATQSPDIYGLGQCHQPSNSKFCSNGRSVETANLAPRGRVRASERSDLRITTRRMSLGPRRAYSRLYARLPSKRDINQCRDSLTNQGIGVQQTGAQRLTGASFPQRSMVRGINEQVARGIPRCTWTIRRPVIHERLQEMREMYNGRETTSIRKNKVINEGIRPSAFSELLNVRVGCEIERERKGRAGLVNAER